MLCCGLRGWLAALQLNAEAGFLGICVEACEGIEGSAGLARLLITVHCTVCWEHW